jgi:TPR repeat protein/Zn-dependent protease with chaperone function
MTGSDASVRTSPRLNPFAFPSETTLRFALLVILALCGSSGQYGVLWDMVHRQEERLADACVANASTTISQMRSARGEAQALELAETATSVLLPRLSVCSKILRPRVAWQITGVLLTAGLTAGLYWLLPVLIRRRRRLEPVTAEFPPGLQAEVQSLCTTVGQPKLPRLMWSPLGIGMPLVFGSNNRHYLAFSAEFVTRLYYDAAAFRTVVLHELAHIHLRDIGKTYLTVATCCAFLLATVLPVLSVFPFVEPRWSDVPDVLVYSVLWSVTIVLVGTSVLRAREYYADVQASVWDGATPAIDRMLGALSEPRSKGWRRCVSFHPTPAERRKAVTDPSRLFAFSPWDAFAIGFVASLVIKTLAGMASGFLAGDVRTFEFTFGFATLGIPACIMLFAVGAVGTGVWRGAFAALMRGDDPTRRAGLLGLAMAAGSAVWAVLSVLRLVIVPTGESDIPFWYSVQTFSLEIATDAIVAVGCFLVFRWITDTASAWLEVVLRSDSPWPVVLSSILAALLLVVGTMGSAYYAVMFYWIEGFRGTTTPSMMFALLTGPPVILASVLVWAFPMAAGFWRRRSAYTVGPGWVLLDRATIEHTPDEPWRLSSALTAASIIGLAFCIWLEATFFAAKGYFPAWASSRLGAIFSGLEAGMEQILGQGNGPQVLPVAAGLFQAAAALVAAALAPRFYALSGLFAASVAGAIIVVFDLTFVTDPNGPMQPGMALAALALLGHGAILALPISVCVAWTKKRIVGRRGSDRTGQARDGSRRARPRLTLLSRGVVACLFITVATGFVVKIRADVLAAQEFHALEAAAERGDGDAENRLGIMYLFGRLVPQDTAKAVFWIGKAAAAGHAEAENTLGIMYLRGRGVSQDSVVAAQWFRRSAEQGSANGENDLGEMYFAGTGVPRDDVSAVEWFRKAADKGNANAQNSLGLAYHLGRGTAPDDGTAIAWFGKAAEQGHAAAQNNLGMMYRLGLGTPQDDGAALLWLRKAADRGFAEAQFNLGQIYEQGGVVTRDEAQAVLLFRKAAAQGYAPAAQQLQAACSRGVGPACGPS